MKVLVQTDFSKLAQAMRAYVHARALKHDRKIIYMQGNTLIEEDPRTAHKQILEPRYNAR